MAGSRARTEVEVLPRLERVGVVKLEGHGKWPDASPLFLFIAMECVAVRLELKNPGTQDWTAEGAQLTAKGGVRPEVRVWQPAPVSPGQPKPGEEVWVEAELPEEAARGRFTLKLWDASGTRTLGVDGVTFP